MSIGGLPALNDGNNARAEIYNRLIEQFKVQMFFSAGNSGPGMNTVGDPSVATKVVSVGAYLSRATTILDYGADTSVRRQPELLHSRTDRVRMAASNRKSSRPARRSRPRRCGNRASDCPTPFRPAISC